MTDSCLSDDPSVNDLRRDGILLGEGSCTVEEGARSQCWVFQGL